MEVTINQTVKRYDVVVNETTKQINVNIINQKKQTSVIISPLGKRGFKGEPSVYTDIELAVTQDDQTQFNIFSEPTIQSNLFINDSIYFKDKSYQIQNISGNWKLIWLDEFQLKTTDLLIFRKI